jgi:hypothetical protein
MTTDGPPGLAGGPFALPHHAPAPPGTYRREAGHTLIELELADLRQLFNSLDPAPFREKDLDAEAEAWITSAAEELPSREPLKLVIWLPTADPAAGAVPDAVAHYFAYRASVHRHELARLLRIGRLALVIGTGFMVLCYALAALLTDLFPSTLVSWLADGLTIFAWVALWRPAEIFLYDWWPPWRRCRLLERLAVMPVEVRVRG